MKIQELKDKLPGLLAKANAYLEASASENRAPTAEEQQGFDDTMAIYEATERQIVSAERAEAAQARLDAPGARKTSHQDVVPAPAPGRPSATPGIEPGRESKGTNGFLHLGDFAMAVCRARAGQMDPRLSRIMAAASTAGSEAVGADGGYAVPADFRMEIIKKVQGEDSLFSMTDQYETESNEVTLLVDEVEPWNSTGGIQVQWLGEGGTFNQTKPKLNETIIRANKIGALVPVSNEALQDATRLNGYITGKVPDKMGYAINAALIGGTGVGQPTGLIGHASVVSQAAEGGQTAGTINYANVTKMWSRMYAPLRSKGVWIINQDVEPQLFTMVVSGGSPALPAYLPPGGLADRPYGTLLGRPVVYSEACSAVGTVGDIIFASFSQYATLLKSGGPRTDFSMHLYFDSDQSAFRVVFRMGGLPLWKTSITRAKSSLPLSWAVTLAAR
jgi:HK97 family phage major capsid protein